MRYAPNVTQHLFTVANLDDYAASMASGVEHLTAHLRTVSKPFSGSSVEHVAKYVGDIDLGKPLDDTAAALEEMTKLYLDDAVYFHDPKYAAHLNCPVVIPALLAEVFVSSVNSSLDTWDQSAGGTLIERKLIDWTADRIGFHDGDGVFTSGGTQSNLQALLMARGRAAADPSLLRIFASADSHFSVQKAANILGIGMSSVVSIPTDSKHRMDPYALEYEVAACLRAGLVPMAVVATAGTTDFGAIDPLGKVADVCREYRVWFHVDAAYGGGLLASTRRRHLLAGIEHADSVTVDYHKTFFQPVSSSAIIVRDAGSLGHITYHADYLNPKTADLPNQVDKSMQTTRRFDALKLWLTLRIMGADQVGDIFDTVIDLAAEVYNVLRDDDDFEVITAPTLSTLIFRFRPMGMDVKTADELNPMIRTRLFSRGDAIVAGTKVDGHAWLKFTLLNPDSTRDDLAEILALIREIGTELLDELATTAGVA